MPPSIEIHTETNVHIYTHPQANAARYTILYYVQMQYHAIPRLVVDAIGCLVGLRGHHDRQQRVAFRVDCVAADDGCGEGDGDGGGGGRRAIRARAAWAIACHSSGIHAMSTTAVWETQSRNTLMTKSWSPMNVRARTSCSQSITRAGTPVVTVDNDIC